jgi:hypothetical protein
MSDLKGQSGEMRATIQITRAATGKVETYELVGGLSAEQLAHLRATRPDAERKVHGCSGAQEARSLELLHAPWCIRQAECSPGPGRRSQAARPT